MYQRDFFDKDSHVVAKKLLGSQIIYKNHSAIITETEAYAGKDDPASHAFKGMTNRNTLMFGKPGYTYIYLIYGMHLCLNITTLPEGTPGSVFIRAIKTAQKHLDGPGKLTKALGVSMNDNGMDICANNVLQISQGIFVPEDQIVQSPRIGIKNGLDKLWRFFIDESYGIDF